MRDLWDVNYNLDDSPRERLFSSEGDSASREISTPTVLVATPSNEHRKARLPISPPSESASSRQKTPSTKTSSVRPPDTIETILETSPSGRPLEASSHNFQDVDSGRQHASQDEVKP